ncbi:MAG: orotidine-5'-phosphate decarboxylase [Spirochaetaceae bacterium]|jgi:orotidine-5'-phosphate decarboxylase|nr:orotidine-5'-phosphate decarboxylase [Spirochaetaceae bacterium]
MSIERLFDAVKRSGPVCVGLDTAPDYIPPKAALEQAAASVLRFNEALIEATVDVSACYKIQIAYYEALGREGMDVYAKTLAYARARGGICIADIKRGDISDTAVQYAKAHFSGDFEADIVTLNPYMGMDSIEPWFTEAERRNKGAFVLLRTSNKGFVDFEGQKTANGACVYDLVGEKLLELAQRSSGNSGYGIFGAVVGAEAKSAAEREEARMLRLKYSKLFFLIPGYGAQGGGAAEAALLLTEQKNGGVINASRSILKAWQNLETGIETTLENAAQAARAAVIQMRDSIKSA